VTYRVYVTVVNGKAIASAKEVLVSWHFPG
jgi:hypothetical protein